MKAIGAIFIFLSLYSLEAAVTLSGVAWLLLGVLLIAPAEILTVLVYIRKNIYRSTKSEQK